MNAVFTAEGMQDTSQQDAADYPVTFDGTAGLFRPAHVSVCDVSQRDAASRALAVLFVSSWGFEELCARKFWRVLAAGLSDRGIASLRFDYAGTGDALDPVDVSRGIKIWLDNIRAAAVKLKELSGAKSLLLVGHGLGGLLAWKVAETIEGVEGIALAAPALSGRNWLREFVALSRIANQGGLQHSGVTTGPAMGEQVLPEATATGLRAINISTAPASPVRSVFLLKQKNRPADDAFSDHLATLGVDFRSEVFEGYEQFIRDVLFSVTPHRAIASICDWAANVPLKTDTPMSVPHFGVTVPEPEPLLGERFAERGVRFGNNNRLYGILCQPRGEIKGATVVVLSTGYDRMSGWGRITTRLCRELAQGGIPSLRFDMGNLADSPPALQAREQIIYSDGQLKDVSAALDFLDREKLFPVVVTGRCSGGWAAFQSAANDPRLSGVVPVNVFDFYIPDDADVEALLISSRQPLSSYGAKLISGGFWRRVLAGEVRIRNGIVNMWAMIVAKAISAITPFMVKHPYLSKRFHTISLDFRKIVSNGTEMTVVYTEGDIGAAMLETNFGQRGRLLDGRYGNPSIVFIEGADHNLTTAEARHAWSDEVKKIALRFKPIP